MLDTLSNFVLGHAYAANAKTSWDFFNILQVRDASGTNARTQLKTILGSVVGWVMAIVMIVAFFYLIMNGIKYITAGGDAAKATEARTGIINAIIGIVIVSMAFVIVRFAANVGSSL